ncbi:hypothetical protein [Paraflavitalea speifideaquila]|uniref:hypothetical protein n=1 Tax=Paraflavitalea speifideaquila TaxID=3076558 RepID=UPI0028F12EDF|nr:hypothetical protein [Paraflavitalea speifideiaquila]
MSKTIITCLLVIAQAALQAQVGIGTTTPHASAAVEIAATDKGLLIPQMTAAQRTAITNPATGLLVIQTDLDKGFYYNAGTPAAPNWLNLSAYKLQQNINTNGKFISGDGTNTGLQVSEGGLVIGTGTFTGTSNNGTLSPGSKLIWAPHKGAFRAGVITGAQWNDVNIGKWSVAMGWNSFAAGEASVALGFSAMATGHNSVAIGNNVSTQGQFGSFIFGDGASTGPYTNTTSNQMLMRFTNGYRFYAGSQTNTASMAVDNTGRIGIGKDNPTEKLDVAGNITYSGTLNMGVQTVWVDYSVSGNSRTTIPCQCPAGTRLIGGGGGHRDSNGAARDITVNYSAPSTENPHTIWRVIVTNSSGSSRAVRVYAICAKVQ